MMEKRSTNIRVGIGGWTFEPWRGTFYPDGLPHKRELEYAAGKLTSIEINGTYYGSQKPETFARWREETPDGFVFAVKGPRFATNRKVLREAGESIERFVNGGLGELKEKLGPINWQFMATKKFDPGDFEAFLRLLPATLDGNPLRHAVEVRHDSFRVPEFVALARRYGVAIVLAADSEYPQIADQTAAFSYVRLMGTRDGETLGYPRKVLDGWVEKARALAAGKRPDGLDYVGGPEGGEKAREVFVYIIAGHKVANPAAATALIGKLG
ncbi:MAG: DUF72 domain-containing protein [Flavobacteriaceae bacterium]